MSATLLKMATTPPYLQNIAKNNAIDEIISSSTRKVNPVKVSLAETEEALGGFLNNPAFMGLDEGVEAAVTPAATPASLVQDSSSLFGTRPAYNTPSGEDFLRSPSPFLDESELNFNFTSQQLEPYNLGRFDTLPSVEQGDLIKARTESARQNIVAREANREALERVRGLEAAGLSDGSISGLLSRRAEIERGAMQIREGMSAQDARAMNRLSNGTDYARPFTNLEQAEMIEINEAINRIGAVGDENFFTRLADYDNYSESVHRNANLATTGENLTEGVSNGNSIGTQSSNAIMGSMDATGLAGIGASMGIGAVVGGAANYGMGGEFSEGAMMGGLAGGGIAIGARAIRANSGAIDNYLRSSVLKASDMDAVKNMKPENLGFMQNMARNRLMNEGKTTGLEARHMVLGGSMLAGVAFTGRRNDKRRGFNAHRGNRI